jgi:hypothetical protein
MIEGNSEVQRIHTIILDVLLNKCKTPTITFELDYSSIFITIEIYFTRHKVMNYNYVSILFFFNIIPSGLLYYKANILY